MPSSACNSNIDDIEDLVQGTDLNLSGNGDHGRKLLVPRPRPNKPREMCKIDADSIIPGTQSIFIKTWGCAHNNSDSEYMAGLLAAYGYNITDEQSKADLWLLNSCTVKNPAEQHFHNMVNEGLSNGKYVVVAGCVPQASPKASFLQGMSIIGVQQIDRVVEVVEEALKGHMVRLLGPKKEGKRKLGGSALSLPKIRKNPLVEIIPINTGCLNHCTYCKTKHARGELGSYPVEEIVERAKQSFEEGVREIWLTSEDTGAYGRDIGVTLPDLLYNLVEIIPQGCMLRLGMTNPPYILEHMEDMAKILSHPRVYSFLHVPVQSGSDVVLGDMKREYCIDEFRQLVDYLKESVPGITIATDIICGFPTETEEDFLQTIDLVRTYKFPSLFINQFYPRPGTPASKMKRIPTQEVKRRTKLLSDVFKSYQPYQHKIGEHQTVLVTEISHDKKHLVGHNKFYEQVLLPKDDSLLGHMIDVVIESAGKHYMTGKVLSVNKSLDYSKSKENTPLMKSNITKVYGMSLTYLKSYGGVAFFYACILSLVCALYLRLKWMWFVD